MTFKGTCFYWWMRYVWWERSTHFDGEATILQEPFLLSLVFSGIRRVITGWVCGCGCTCGRVWKHRGRKVSRKCRGSYKKRENHRKTMNKLEKHPSPRSRKQIIQTYQRGSTWKRYIKRWARGSYVFIRARFAEALAEEVCYVSVNMWKLRRKKTAFK